MPNPERVEGRCNAKLKGGRGYCGNKPAYGPDIAGGRCFYHGAGSTGAKTQAGQKRAAEANIRHSYYRSMLKSSWSPERLQAFDAANTSTDVTDEIALVRSNIVDIERRMGNGEVTVMGVKGEVFLEDIKDRLHTRLNMYLRSQHEMHPEADKQKGKLKIEISIGQGVKAETEAKASLDGNEEDIGDLEAPIANAPAEEASKPDSIENALSHLEDP